MTPVRNYIYDAKIEFGEVTYARPCIVTSAVVSGFFSVVPLSSARDLYEGLPFHFIIEDTDSDFKATGLLRSSFAVGDEIAELKIADLIRKRGRLEGELLKRFLKWIN